MENMNLYLVSQDINSDWDTFDSMIVSAKSEYDARRIHPSMYITHHKNDKWYITNNGKEMESFSNNGWIEFKDINELKVEYIGKSIKPEGVILSSFNAG